MKKILAVLVALVVAVPMCVFAQDAPAAPAKEFAVYLDKNMVTEVGRDLHSTLVRFVVPDDIGMAELPNLWASHLQTFLDKTEGYFPYNMLLIPTFFREITMSIDRLIMSSPRSFEKIIEQIKPMSEFIGVFLDALCRCDEKTLRAVDAPKIIVQKAQKTKNTKKTKKNKK